MSTQAYYRFEVRCRIADRSGGQTVRQIVERNGFTIGDLSYRLDNEAQLRRYSMTIASTHRDAAARLASTLESADFVRDFRIAPSGN